MRKQIFPQGNSAKHESIRPGGNRERQLILQRLTALIDSVKTNEGADMGRRKTRNSRKSPNTSAEHMNTQTSSGSNVAAPPKMASLSDSPNSPDSVVIDVDNQTALYSDESIHAQSQPVPNSPSIDSSSAGKLANNLTMPNLSFYPVPTADGDVRTPARRPDTPQPSYSSTPIQ